MTAKPPLDLITDPRLLNPAFRVWCWVDHLHRVRGGPVRVSSGEIGRALRMSLHNVGARYTPPLLAAGWATRQVAQAGERDVMPSWTIPPLPAGPTAELPERLIVDTRVSPPAMRVWAFLDHACRVAGGPVELSGADIAQGFAARTDPNGHPGGPDRRYRDQAGVVARFLADLESFGYVCQHPAGQGSGGGRGLLTVDQPRT